VPKEHKLKGFASHRSCCAITSFQEGGCKIALPNRAGQWICLSGTKYQDNHKYVEKLCDLMFLWDRSGRRLLSAALELKGGGVDVTGVVDQLQHGADIVADLTIGLKLEFLPVLIHRRLSSVQVDALKKKRVRFRGDPFPIALLRCGGRVLDLSW
jgi:hypothetical protein